MSEPRKIYAGSKLCPPIAYMDEGPYAGWLMVKHPDGQWVTIERIYPDKESTILLEKNLAIALAEKEKLQHLLDDARDKLRRIAELNIRTITGTDNYNCGVAQGHLDAVRIASSADLGPDWRKMCEDAKELVKSVAINGSTCSAIKALSWLKSYDEAAK